MLLWPADLTRGRHLEAVNPRTKATFGPKERARYQSSPAEQPLFSGDCLVSKGDETSRQFKSLAKSLAETLGPSANRA